MLVCIPNVLDAGQLVSLRARLDGANEAWVDGRVTAGYQGAPVTPLSDRKIMAPASVSISGGRPTAGDLQAW